MTVQSGDIDNRHYAIMEWAFLIGFPIMLVGVAVLCLVLIWFVWEGY